MAKIFIGMPAYNGKRFIEEAIACFARQTYTDWKLFISDDCSTDGTQEIYEAWVKKDPRIIYHRQEKNIGMFPNFDFVLRKADGEYFMWASQDDIWENEFLATCVGHLENDKNIGFAVTTVADVDSFGRTLREMPSIQIFSGKRSAWKVARYVLQPEILGKCHLMYGLYRLECVRKIWTAYPLRHEWGSDYLLALAGISRFGCAVDTKVLFKKRQGGFSSPGSTKDDRLDMVKKVEYKNPKNHMFPQSVFNTYFRGHMEALSGTLYRPLVAILLFARLPRAFFIRIKRRFI